MGIKDKDNSIVNIDSARDKTADLPAKKSGRGGYRKNSTFPQVRKGFGENAEDKALISRLLTEALDAYSQTRVKSDEELAERLATYFKVCAESGRVPTVEEMVMYTGYTYATVWDWETGRRKGFSSETAEIVKKAKEYIKTFDAKLVVSGKENPIVYFFRAKNYYGMQDKQEFVINAGNRNDDEISAEDIAKRYLDDGKTVVTTFSDDE